MVSIPSTAGIFGFLTYTPVWAWLVPLILVGGAVGITIAYYRSSTFHDAVEEGLQSVFDASSSSKSAPSKTLIRKVTPDEYNNIIARIGVLFTSRRYIPHNQSSGLYVYQKQEAPRGCLMIFVHIIVALLLFALCIVPGIIYLVVIFSKGDKIRAASVQVTVVPEGYSFNIKAPGGIKRKIYQILAPYSTGAPAAPAYAMGSAPQAVTVPPIGAYQIPGGPGSPPLPPQQPAPPIDTAQAFLGTATSDPPVQQDTGPTPDEKECPYCAEMIKVKAVKCKHCGSDLS